MSITSRLALLILCLLSTSATASPIGPALEALFGPEQGAILFVQYASEPEIVRNWMRSRLDEVAEAGAIPDTPAGEWLSLVWLLQRTEGHDSSYPVPEPSTAACFALGLVGLAWGSCRTRRSRSTA